VSGDKKLTTDALETLGTIIDEKAGRDAIHLAVEPAIAAQLLKPGTHVGFIEGGVGVCEDPVGIVDPFLKEPVTKGQRFWLVVYPRTITSLRHVWTHPAFGELPMSVSEDRKKRSEEWLRNYCASESDAPEYETLLALACGQLDEDGGWSHQGEYLLCMGSDAHGQIPPDLWDHVENVLGKKIPSEKRATYFSCSC